MKYLTTEFLSQYIGRQPEWGPVGYITYKRTYARPLESCPVWEQELAKQHGVYGTEEFWLTLARVVEGTFLIQESHILDLNLPWFEEKAQKSAQIMYDLMWNMKFLPPGRGLFMMGTDYLIERGTSAPLNNCAFVSTKNIAQDFSEPFEFLADMSMLGVGVGFDTEGANTVLFGLTGETFEYRVRDSREGWVDAIGFMLDALVGRAPWPELDVSLVRPEGAPIKGFGGTSSGPGPLLTLASTLYTRFSHRKNHVSSVDIVDIANLIGRCIIAGNVRRSAEIALGDLDDQLFLQLKDSSNPETNLWRWASNNSVKCMIGDNFSNAVENTKKRGEPGFVFVDTARKYGRLRELPNNNDYRVLGCNPCGEQFLESYELCNLVETFPARHESLRDYLLTLKYAYLYAKTVTLLPTHNPKTNAVMMRNRRIGCSMSGITEAINKFGAAEFFLWCDEGYDYLYDLDTKYSEWLCIPRSNKRTTVKPSGTISKLVGCSSGVHNPVGEFYYQTIRFSKNSSYLDPLKRAGYKVVDISDVEPNTVVVYFPVKQPNFSKAEDETSIWQQLELAAQMQYWWADNAVSCTVKVRPDELSDILPALEIYQHRLKGISFLPVQDLDYAHPPWQKITEEEYNRAKACIGSLDLNAGQHEEMEKFCDGETCTI